MGWGGAPEVHTAGDVKIRLTPGPSVQSTSLSPGSHLIPHGPRDVVQALLSQSRSHLQAPPLSSDTF